METWKQAQKIVGSNGNRVKDDFYPTPAYCTDDLLRVEKFSGSVWEPACGNGAISKVLQVSGIDVYSSDLIYRGFGDGGKDFLLEKDIYDNIITNPPYKLAEKFVVNALRCSRNKVAMFLKLSFLEGKARQELFRVTPLSKVWVYSARVNCFEDAHGSGMLAFAWFVWEHGYKGEPKIGWL